MILNETYVNDDIIARMCFYTNENQRRGDGTKFTGSDISANANILTTYGSAIEVRCTKEQYTVALQLLEKRHEGGSK
jgi:hypothetical protein